MLIRLQSITKRGVKGVEKIPFLILISPTSYLLLKIKISSKIVFDNSVPLCHQRISLVVLRRMGNALGDVTFMKNEIFL